MDVSTIHFFYKISAHSTPLLWNEERFFFVTGCFSFNLFMNMLLGVCLCNFADNIHCERHYYGFYLPIARTAGRMRFSVELRPCISSYNKYMETALGRVNSPSGVLYDIRSLTSSYKPQPIRISHIF